MISEFMVKFFVMETTILNYRIIVEPDVRVGTEESGFSAYCPTLDIADGGSTIEAALSSIQEGIECRIEALIAEGLPIPQPDNVETTVVSTGKVKIPKNYPLAEI